ncbi:MAG: YicC family protein [Rhodobacteraceae bacterium TMED111]|nr:YicC family protein [Marinovum sp.]OUV43659.1 MAG: YicC family protein [Rhodobacteraceae bacterium TMED111]
MTGYASDTILVGDFSLDAEIKSVNSKSFDLKIYLPEYMTSMENDIRQLVSKQIARGSIVLKIKAKHNDEASSNFTLNNEVLNTAIDEIKTIEQKCDEKNIQFSPLTILDFFSVKGVWEENKISQTDSVELKSVMLDKLSELIKKFIETRRIEGQGLQAILVEKLSSIMEFIKEIDKILPDRSRHLKKNFKTALDRVINEQNQLDEIRLEQEIALLVIKQDIQEELDRLKVHIVSMQDLVNSSNVVGKKLDFLSQELNREVNTICSKSQYSDLTKLGIEMKTLVDQFREQVQNVE